MPDNLLVYLLRAAIVCRVHDRNGRDLKMFQLRPQQVPNIQGSPGSNVVQRAPNTTKLVLLQGSASPTCCMVVSVSMPWRH